MQLAPATPTAPAPHVDLAQRSFDEFAAAYDALVPTPVTDSARSSAVAHVLQGVDLLGKAYAAIPAGAYHPGNEVLTRTWATTAIEQLGAGDARAALATLDEVIERVSNDFDLQ